MTERQQARFRIGQTVVHKQYGFRAVIIDADPIFSLSEDWYEERTQNRPPKNKPWYHVLVDGTDAQAYVAERNLTPDHDDDPIEHPDLSDWLDEGSEGGYQAGRPLN